MFFGTSLMATNISDNALHVEKNYLLSYVSIGQIHWDWQAWTVVFQEKLLQLCYQLLKISRRRSKGAQYVLGHILGGEQTSVKLPPEC
jgi:hypothetical protein